MKYYNKVNENCESAIADDGKGNIFKVKVEFDLLGDVNATSYGWLDKIGDRYQESTLEVFLELRNIVEGHEQTALIGTRPTGR